MPEPWTEDRIEVAPHRAVPVRVYGGQGLPAAAPLVLHLHGGAFSGSLEGGRAVATVLASAGAAVVSVDYPRAPAHPFPAALEAAYGVLIALDAKRARGAARRRKLFIAGEEAGGNLAAALALVSRDRLSPVLAGQVLLSPMLDPRLATCSVRAVEAGPTGCRWADGWHDYLGTPDKACHPYAAPAMASRLGGVAPALVLTGPADPMRDEAAAYAARLRDSGVPVRDRIIQAPGAWPDALFDAPDSPGAEPAWAAEVRDALIEFFAAPSGPAPDRRA